MAQAHGKNAFMFILVTVLIDMIGFGIIAPVLPTLVTELTGITAAEAAIWGGLLTAVYALMNFLMGPFIGNLSDRFGRRPVLLISLGTLAIDFIIMGLANSIWMLFLGRFLAGISGATFSTANAYIADVTSPEERGKAFGMVGAAFGIGFIIGPAIGGYLSGIDTRAPFFAAAGLAALNMLYGLFVLPESLSKEDRRPFSILRANPLGAFQHFSKLPHVSWLLLAIGLFALAHFVFPSTWAWHGKIRYDWSEEEIGLSLALVGLASAIAQGGLMGPVLKRFGPVKTAQIGITVNVLALIGFAFAGSPVLLYTLILFSGFGGFAGPAVNSLMSNATPKDSQGELQGANASIQSVAAIFSPLIMTQTLRMFSVDDAPIYFPGAAFMLAAILSLVAIIPFRIGIRSLAAHQQEEQASKDAANA